MTTTYTLAIDYGTSSTAAVVVDEGGAAQLVELGGAARIPSVVLMTTSGELVAGEAALAQGMNTPDRVEWTPKRRLGDRMVLLGEKSVAPVAMAAATMRLIADEVTRRHGGQLPSAVRLTYPARWGTTRANALVQAAAEAGLTGATVVPEPVAAAIHLGLDHVDVGGFVAVYDLGGGTFDTAVLRRTDDGFEVVGAAGGIDRLGGEDFDERLYHHVGDVIARQQPEAWEQLRFSTDRAWAHANHSMRVQARAAKEALSAASDYTIYLGAPVDIEVRITRDEFEKLILPDVERTVEELLATVDRAGLTPDDLSDIFLVGGSSRVPLVSREVAARLGRVPTTWGDPKAVVALGAGAATTAMLTSTPAATGAEVLTGDAPLTEATIGPDPPLMHADSPATVGLGPTTAPEPADHRVSEPEPTRARSVGSAGAPEPADVLEPGTAEPSPIPPFTRAEPATADDDVDAEPSDPVLLDPDAVLADEAVTSTTSRRRRALVLVAAGVVALIAGVVVFGGQDPKVETGTTVLPPETSIQVGAEDISRTVDPTTKAGGVGVAATFVLRGPDGDALTTDIALTNTTTESITASHIEAIPKGWAPSADQVTFTVQPTEIIDADPVVRWDLPLDAGQTVHLVYEVALGNIEMSQEALDEQLELRDQAGASFLTDHPWAQAFSAFTGAPMTELTWATRPGEPVGPGTTASNTPGPGCPPDCGPDTTLSGGGGGGGGGGGPTTQTTQTTPTQQPTPSAPGSVSGVRVQSPSGPQGAMRVSLNWAAPGSGGAPSGYRVRATTRALNFTGDGCTGGARDVRSSTYPATGTSGSFVSPSTAEACSWVVWEVQAWNSGGSSSWATARGVLPSVKGQWEAYHLVRAVGGLAVNGGTVSCGIERDNHCSTSPTGEIAPGTLVRVFTQS